ncbi:hypothetical protein A0J61_11779 [Choanephora cucurbitarum]|uniref:Uncharacterized protein n=1 Tax=Choanephora cucurbitarum TaxID=101091 RepID=A0A1C7MTK1_9FUNG|nr:hypothetical protein A0J61_11779 [Choanephora cucurbitarum]
MESGQNCASWYVGEVITYFIHSYHGSSKFLALISVVESSTLEEYGVPSITLFHEDSPQKKYMVCDVEDITNIVGFVRYNENVLQHRLIWPDAMHHKKIDNLKKGELGNM